MNSVDQSFQFIERKLEQLDTLKDIRDKKNKDKSSNEARFQDKLESELQSMVHLSVKGQAITEDALMNSEVTEEKTSQTDELISKSIQEIYNKFSKTTKENPTLSADDIDHLANIGSKEVDNKHFVLNVNGENILLSEEQKNNIKKQIELLEKFDDSNIQIKVKDNAKYKFIKRSTDDLITKHRDFLEKFKGMIKSAREESDVMKQMERTNAQVDESLKYLGKKNESFFEGLISDMHKSKITKKPLELRDEINKLNQEFGTAKVFGDAKSEIAKAENSLINDLNNEMAKIENSANESMANNSGQYSKSGGNESQKMDLKELLKTDNLKNLIADNLNSKSDSVKVDKVDSSRNYQFFNNVRIKDIISNTLKAVKSVPENGSTIARMALNPKSLGKVFVEIVMINNKAQINFKTETKEVMRAIESQIENLSVKLAEQGIVTEAIDLNMNEQDMSKDKQNDTMKHFARKDEAKARQDFLDSFKKLNEKELG